MKKRSLFGAVIILSFLLTSCNIFPPGKSGEDLTYEVVRKSSGYTTHMPSIGDIKLLVVPVQFSDALAINLPNKDEGTRADLQAAFFGNSSNLRYESVASYYRKSSYQKLNLTGTVLPWFTGSGTALELAQKNTTAIRTQVVQPIMREIKQIYGANFLKQFDYDQDGYIDGIYFIYAVESKPQKEGWPEDASNYWAFTAYNGGVVPSTEGPGVYSYVWASYDFMYQDGQIERSENGKPLYDENNQPYFHPYKNEDESLSVDAHTYIHETGHLLGLPDYYSYDEELGDWGASGTLDMMDYNVGDHNGYSKSVLGWTTPLVITDSQRITLSSFTETGQFVLLSTNYKNTLIDEYLILEFYTPTSLNAYASLNQYAGRYPKLFTEPGLKVYHVDSRLARWRYVGGEEGYKFDGYQTEIKKPYSGYYGIGNSNTASKSGEMNYKLLHLLEKNGQNSFKHNYFATNQTLLVEGDSFGYSTFVDFTFNSGLKSNFRFYITALTHEEIEIQIVRYA